MLVSSYQWLITFLVGIIHGTSTLAALVLSPSKTHSEQAWHTTPPGSKRCPNHCDSCTRNGTCHTCSPGWYGNSCSQLCHNNCYTCSSGGECDICNRNGVFGPLCEQSSDLCIDGLFNRSRCTLGCVDGHFQALLHTETRPVKTHYLACINKQLCGWGRFNDSAGQCRDCPEHCRSCSSASQCRLCIGQRYGAMCEHVNCSSIINCSRCQCASVLCFKNDIKCIKCDRGYAGDRCQVNNTVDEDIDSSNSHIMRFVDESESIVTYQNDVASEVTSDDITPIAISVCSSIGGLLLLGAVGVALWWTRTRTGSMTVSNTTVPAESI